MIRDPTLWLVSPEESRVELLVICVDVSLLWRLVSDPLTAIRVGAVCVCCFVFLGYSYGAVTHMHMGGCTGGDENHCHGSFVLASTESPWSSKIERSDSAISLCHGTQPMRLLISADAAHWPRQTHVRM